MGTTHDKAEPSRASLSQGHCYPNQETIIDAISCMEEQLSKPLECHVQVRAGTTGKGRSMKLCSRDYKRAGFLQGFGKKRSEICSAEVT